MIDRGAAYRLCRKHRAVCHEDAEADLVECPVGPHMLEDGEWDVGQEKVGVVISQGGGMKCLKMAKFHGGDMVMYIRLVQKKRPPFAVTVRVEDGEGQGKSGTLHSSNTEVDGIAAFAVEVAKAEHKGWKVAAGRAGGGSPKSPTWNSSLTGAEPDAIRSRPRILARRDEPGRCGAALPRLGRARLREDRVRAGP